MSRSERLRFVLLALAFLLVLIALSGCKDRPEPVDYECTLFVISEMTDVARPYLACRAEHAGLLFLWADEYATAPADERETLAWIEAHRLPESWFAEDLSPLPGTPPMLAEREESPDAS